MAIVRNSWTHVLAMVLVVTWIIPVQRLQAADGDAKAASNIPLKLVPQVVKLDDKGRMVGSVVQPGGKPGAKQVVVLGREGKPIARTETDSEGQFHFDHVKPGTYQLVTTDIGLLVDCKSPQESRPETADHVIVNKDVLVARGQGLAGSSLLHPLFVGLVIAAAIAIPIAISANDDDDRS